MGMDLMLSGAIDRIADLVRRSHARGVVAGEDARLRKTFVSDPYGKKRITAGDAESEAQGETAVYDWPPDLYRVSALSLNGLAEVVKAAPRRGASVLCLVDDGAVVVVLDDDGLRQDRVELELEETEAMAYLDQPKWTKQVTFQELLASAFDDQVQPSLRPLIATMRFVVRDDDKQTASATGRAAISREAMAEAVGLDNAKLPEEILVTCRPTYGHIWRLDTGQELTYEAAIRCRLLIDLKEQALMLRPIDGEIERVRLEARHWIINRLSEAMIGSGCECKIVEGRL